MKNTEYVFAADVLQHKALAITKNKNDQYEMALSLIQKSFFSPQYYIAGSEMLKDLADHGHAPSQTAHANLLLKINTTENQEIARLYYTQAANQGYKPAQDKLTTLYDTRF